MKTRSMFIMSALLTTIVLIAAMACGGTQETPQVPPTATPINVSAIIQEALQAQPQGMTPEQVSQAVQSALAAQPGVTEAQVADAIAKALAAQP